MKFNVKILLLSTVSCLLVASAALAQDPPKTTKTEAGDPSKQTPRDDIYDKTTIKEKRILTYDHIREADVFWEKRIWRVIDVREKINKPFMYPERPFFSILMDAAKEGKITAYSAIDDKFQNPYTPDEVSSLAYSSDTIIDFDPVTLKEIGTKVVTNEKFTWKDIKRFRMKEVWVFDEESSTMQVRILGIAPMLEEVDLQGNFKLERPLFWVYYPEVRKILAQEPAFNIKNDAGRMSWEDIMEKRYFSSYIMKESNVYDRRIEDYKSGMDRLMEADRIKESIFEFEHDLWSY